MSTGTRLPLRDAAVVADALVGMLAVGCERIEVAGSIRRRRPEVGDIEIVAIPKWRDAPVADLWSDTTERVSVLEEQVAHLMDLGELAPRDVEVHRADGRVEYQRRMGEAYKALVFRGMPVDLFVVHPPAEWGVIFAIRTGPGDWNQKIVTDCQRYFRKVSGGQVMALGVPVPCPEERDFFRAVGQPWLEPWDRAVGRVEIRRPAAVSP